MAQGFCDEMVYVFLVPATTPGISNNTFMVFHAL
jgi:hypothetical protein